MVHVIDDVSEGHAVDSSPLKKLHSERTRTARNRHYIRPAAQETDAAYDGEDDDVKEYRPEGSRYSDRRI